MFEPEHRNQETWNEGHGTAMVDDGARGVGGSWHDTAMQQHLTTVVVSSFHDGGLQRLSVTQLISNLSLEDVSRTRATRKNSGVDSWCYCGGNPGILSSEALSPMLSLRPPPPGGGYKESRFTA